MKKQKENNLKIKIEADVAKCLKGLDSVQKRLDGIEASIKRLASMNVNVTGVISGKDLLMSAKRSSGSSSDRFA